MLLFSRKKNESLVLGLNGEIVVTIVEIMGDKTRIGIESPNKIPVYCRDAAYRYEAIYEQKEKTG